MAHEVAVHDQKADERRQQAEDERVHDAAAEVNWAKEMLG